MRTLNWVKGHGTENDFVVVFDPEGTTYDWIDADAVRLICDRRRGVGADGLLRVVRSTSVDGGWFMDFRNADGSVGEMCGNGVRVFARYLVETGLVDADAGATVVTRAGTKQVRFLESGASTVDMGPAGFPPSEGLKISAAGRTWSGVAVDMGNPHGVCFVDSLEEPGPLVEAPTWSPADVFPAGANIEFAVRVGPPGDRHLAMRVHERGVGETRSCGTGACSVAAVTALVDGVEGPWSYRVDVPGGTLRVDRRPDGHLELTGPAELTARGTLSV